MPRMRGRGVGLFVWSVGAVVVVAVIIVAVLLATGVL